MMSRGRTGHDRLAADPSLIRVMLMLRARSASGTVKERDVGVRGGGGWGEGGMYVKAAKCYITCYLPSSSPKSVMVQNVPFPAPFSANTRTW